MTKSCRVVGKGLFLDFFHEFTLRTFAFFILLIIQPSKNATIFQIVTRDF